MFSIFIFFYFLCDKFLENAITTFISVITSKIIAIYDLYTIAYISQHIAANTPIPLISFSLFSKNDITTMTEATIGNIEYIFWNVSALTAKSNTIKNVETSILFFNLYFSNI